VGRVYQQTVIDTYAKVAFAKLYDRKTPITAAEALNDRVVPFYDEHGIRSCWVLTDRGTEFCGSESHEYELYLAVEDMRRTWLRGRENVHKRYLVHVARHDLGVLMRLLIGAGTPREAAAPALTYLCSSSTPSRLWR
jgi:hypothetical protein